MLRNCVMVRVRVGAVVSLGVLLVGCEKKQEIIFEAHSITYKRGAEDMIEDECRKISEDLEEYRLDGWRVVASSPKEMVINKGIRILVWEDRTSPSCLTALVR